ncbi:MAG: hydrogenase expression/formation protein HypE [Candidatus Omnitrophica bacterium]|nr:hydrogenase expression/formation protein HypE [Candidatus Omnitrophota bacterium]
MDKKPDKIKLAHGNGGLLMQELIHKLLLKKLYNPLLSPLGDSATFDLKREQIAFTTDSFVVSPLFFKGANIGKLAVYGTINDLVVSGAIPRFLSLSLIIEEGLEYGILEKIIDSIASTAKKEDVWIVTGDLKVVEKGSCDKIFINTSGIGRIIYNQLSVKIIEPEDRIIITGSIGEHGLSVLAGRKKEGLDFGIRSDCASLKDLILPLLKKNSGIKFMRDPTRGGLASLLNEITSMSTFSLLIEEKNIPIKPKVRTCSELLGLDPLYLANEGKAVLVVERKSAPFILKKLKQHPLGRDSCIIGKVIKDKNKKVLLKTLSGGLRIVEPPIEELLPRIC